MSARVGMRMWRRGRWVLRWALVYFTVCIIFDERWSMCLVGVDIGVDEPALTDAEDGDGLRIEDDGSRS